MDYLMHHGIKGQKWGVRRYQNPDGSLTNEGRRRYGFVNHLNKKQEKILDAVSYKAAVAKLKRDGYFDSYGRNKDESRSLYKLAKSCKSVDEFDKKSILKYGDHPADVLYDAYHTIRENRKKIALNQHIEEHFIQSTLGSTLMATDSINMASTINMQSMQQTMIDSINGANMASSLAMTGGMNPYVFGMM